MNNTEDALSIYLEAVDLLKKGNIKDAEVAFRTSFEKAPHAKTAFRIFECRTKLERADAAEWIQRAYVLNEKDNEVASAMCTWLWKSGQYELAKAALASLLNRSPDYGLGIALQKEIEGKAKRL